MPKFLHVVGKPILGPVQEAAPVPSLLHLPKQEELLYDPEDFLFVRQQHSRHETAADGASWEREVMHRRLPNSADLLQDSAGDGTKNVCGICGKM